MSTEVGNCFALPLTSQNYSMLGDNLTLSCGENDDYTDENYQSHHYEPLPLNEPLDQLTMVTGPSMTSRAAPMRSRATLGPRNILMKSASLPTPENVACDLPDPFPELSHDRLGPVSARMYGIETTSSLPASPDKNTSIESLSRSAGPISPTISCGIYDGSAQTDNSCAFRKKIMMDIYVNERKHHSVEIDDNSTVASVCGQLAQLNHLRRDPFWTIVEHLDKFNIERSLEDHERLYPIFQSWHSTSNHFYFRKDYYRYELYSNPNHCFPQQMLDVELPKEDSSGLMTRHELYRNLLLKGLLANQSLPDIQGYLHVRDGKKAWKKYFCVLRQSGLYCITKGSIKDTRHMVLLSDISSDSIYLALNAKKVFGAPTQHCFCLAPSNDTSDKHRLRQFCAEDEQSRLCWITGMRFIKFGSQLLENCRNSVHWESGGMKITSNECNGNFESKSLSPTDFSSEKVRVVDNPVPSMGLNCQEGKNIKGKPYRSSILQSHRPLPRVAESLPTKAAPSKNGLSLPCAAADDHRNLDWFHDTIGRDEAVSLICGCGLSDGTFLVRHSQTLSGVFVLSFVHNLSVKHCTIHKVNLDGCWYFSLDGGSTKFMDLAQLIDFYRLNAGRLPTCLTRHVKRLH